ncbi:MAG: hypothetical protein QXS16_02275 [Pyrobaculum sp.]
MRTARSRPVKTRQSIDLDPLQAAEEVVKFSIKLRTPIYVCNDGEVLHEPCSVFGKNTVVTFNIKDVERKFVFELNPDKIDEDVRTPLIEEVVKTVREHTDALLKEASKMTKFASDYFNITYYKFVYDVYLGEMMVPIGEASGAFFRLEGYFKIIEKTDDDKSVETVLKKS